MNEREVFIAALQEGSATERRAYLDAACGGDDGLRRGVEALLAAHERAGSFLEHPLVDPAVTTDDPISERPGTVIGPYRLMEQIGEGGMGLVFVAEQQQPIRRKVALKVIKPGMDTRQVVARFEAERQALALMDHPNIAKVLGGGTTDSGRPYFVMELVKGVPITEYCDQNQVSIRQRLELFVSVCQAVQHAHQKGIIHRDLKPSNVLVVSHDGTPVVKIIDFGVAKAIGQQLTDKTIYTQFSQMVGTPLYMSPEQAGQSGLDVDTRSDIYSLGVLLYELLTSTTPFDRERLRELSYDEMRRIIREEEPPKPSTRISTLGKAAATMSTQRQSEPKQLSRLIRGELDWIVMKALEKDRNRRYETASGLAMDVQRYLHDEPVLACPPTVGYRLKKFWQRNRGLASATAVVFLCLVGGIVGTSWGLTKAVHAQGKAQDEADAARQARQDEEFQRQLAEKEKARAEDNLKQARLAVDKLLTRVAADLEHKPHMEQIRRALLVDALQFYEGFLAQKPTDAPMRHETARAYLRVGDIQQMLGHGPGAEAAMRQAVALLKKLADEFPGVPVYREDLAQSRASLSYRIHFAMKYEESTKLRRQVLADWQKLAADFPTVPSYQRRVAYAHTDLGNALKNALGRLGEAEQYYRQAVAAWKKLEADFPNEPVDHFGVSHSRLWFGVLLVHTGRLVEAAPELQQAVAIRERLVAQFSDDVGLKKDLALAQRYLADLLQRTGKPDQAVQTNQRAIALREKLQDDFPHDAENRRELSWMYCSLGNALLALDRTREAVKYLEESLQLMKAKHDSDDLATLAALDGVAQSYLTLAAQQAWLGQEQEWAATCERGLSLARDTTIATLADKVAKMCSLRPSNDKRRRAALLLARRAVELGKGHQYLAYFQMALGMAEYRSGYFAEADAALLAAMEAGKHEPRIAGTSAFYRALSLFRQGKPDAARQLATQAAAKMKPLPKDAKNPLAGGYDDGDLILWLAYREAKDAIKFDEKSEAGAGPEPRNKAKPKA
jgi:eukaryotic-like serine/threonine-protein kinase